VRWTGQSHRCAWSPNHEFSGSGCRHRNVSIVWTAQTSCAQYMWTIYPTRWMAFEFLPNRHLITSFKTVIPRISFCFFYVVYINNSFKIKNSTGYKNNLLKISWKLKMNTYLKSSKPWIDIRSPLTMSGNLTLLKGHPSIVSWTCRWIDPAVKAYHLCGVKPR